MKKVLIGVLVIAVLALGMLFTCPDREKHVAAIQNLATSVVNKASNESGEGDSLGDNLFTYFMSGISRFMIEQKLYVEDYYFYSIGKIDFDGKSEMVSIGVFGRVFTIDSETAYQKIKDKFEKEELN